MWFTREQFNLCNELRLWGLEPRFEPGDIVARGFADLGFEEFQVLPGPSLLSLTAGTVSRLPEDHQGHFFWIPSVDESVTLLESKGAEIQVLRREDGREWHLQCVRSDDHAISVRGDCIHTVVLQALHQVLCHAIKQG